MRFLNFFDYLITYIVSVARIFEFAIINSKIKKLILLIPVLIILSIYLYVLITLVYLILI